MNTKVVTSSTLEYTLCVMGAAYGTQQSASALRFARALLHAQHRILGVFFYGEGVHNANCLVSPASDEENLVQGWQQLYYEHAVPLFVCVAAAQRRGVSMDAASLSNLADGFEASGLTTLTELLLTSDRTIQF